MFVKVHITREDTTTLLEAFLPPVPGFFLYFPQRRNMAPKLRALVDHVRHFRGLRDVARNPL